MKSIPGVDYTTKDQRDALLRRIREAGMKHNSHAEARKRIKKTAAITRAQNTIKLYENRVFRLAAKLRNAELTAKRRATDCVHFGTPKEALAAVVKLEKMKF